MPDSPRTSAHDLYTQAASLGVAPFMYGGSHWAVRPDLIPRLAGALRMPALAGFTTRAATPSGEPTHSGIAVIPLSGVITPAGSFLSFLFGGSPGGLQGFRDAFDVALNSADVTAIVIDVDSPGGLCDMVTETAEEVFEGRGRGKPIIAVADTLMCSAAYWIASQADEIVSTPSGYAGSVGVYRVHEDWSRANADMGVGVTYVAAGKYKTEGNQNEPLDGEAAAHWQADVQDVYDTFVADVARGRGITPEQVIADYGEGRALNANRALAAGLVDRVLPFEDLISELLGTPESTPSGSALRIARKAAAGAAALAAAVTPPAATHDEDEEEPDVEENEDISDEDEPEKSAMSEDERDLRVALLLAD